MDFNKVRDGRVSSLRHLDVDLSVAHLLSDSTFKQYDIAGDAIYIDADPSGGIATIYIQPVDSSQAEVPLYASPGTIFNVPFTRIRVVNAAQPGKILRVVYGVGVDFQPGSNAQTTVSGVVSISNTPLPVSISGGITDWRFADAAAGVSYRFDRVTTVSGGGFVPKIGLYNPPASAKSCFVERIRFYNAAGVASTLSIDIGTLPTSGLQIAPTPKLINGAACGAIGYYTDGVTDVAYTVSAQKLHSGLVLANGEHYDMEFNTPVIIPAGFMLVIRNNTAASGISASFDFIEK